MPKYFPIQTATSCKLKWSWSSLYLNKGTTSSCHRAGSSVIPDDFDQFHNTSVKLAHRESMLRGEWPNGGCEYCKHIEESGGTSDRMFQNQIPDAYPPKLDSNPLQTTVAPAILEVFFSNTCNLGCVYCNASLSSTIQAEDQLWGGPKIPLTDFLPSDSRYKDYNPKFWNWFENNSNTLQRLHVLGGEPFLQKDLHKMLDFFEQSAHPNLEFNLVTNLSLDPQLMSKSLDRLAELKNASKLKRIDLQVSIDSWDQSQEYVRHNLKLTNFERNMNYLIDKNCYRIGLLSTVNSLTIHGMPELAQKYKEWNLQQTIFWYMHLVIPSDSVFDPTIFDFDIFAESLEQTRKLLPNNAWDDERTIEIFNGIASKLEKQCSNNVQRQRQLLNFLTVNDQRRGTSWQQQFPWLAKVFKNNHVV